MASRVRYLLGGPGLIGEESGELLPVVEALDRGVDGPEGDIGGRRRLQLVAVHSTGGAHLFGWMDGGNGWDEGMGKADGGREGTTALIVSSRADVEVSDSSP
jgi:hypothetical protein